MKNIAILTCLKANDVCTGAGCLNAFFEKKAYFSRYKNETLRLVAFWCCNGCKDAELDNQQGLVEKLERILSLNTDIVHLGICTRIHDEWGRKIECPRITEIVTFLKNHGIDIVAGTHE